MPPAALNLSSSTCHYRRAAQLGFSVSGRRPHEGDQRAFACGSSSCGLPISGNVTMPESKPTDPTKAAVTLPASCGAAGSHAFAAAARGRESCQAGAAPGRRGGCAAPASSDRHCRLRRRAGRNSLDPMRQAIGIIAAAFPTRCRFRWFTPISRPTISAHCSRCREFARQLSARCSQRIPFRRRRTFSSRFRPLGVAGMVGDRVHGQRGAGDDRGHIWSPRAIGRHWRRSPGNRRRTGGFSRIGGRDAAGTRLAVIGGASDRPATAARTG